MADNGGTHPENLNAGRTGSASTAAGQPENSSDDSAITAVATSSTDALSPSPQHLAVPAEKPRHRRLLPSEEATLLAEKPTPEARRRSNATRSTRHILLHFSGSAPRYVSPEERKRREEWEARRRSALAALERLREPTKRSRIEHFWRVKTRSETLRLHHEPADYDAREACGFWFPKPAEFPIHVCDFRAEGGSRQTATLADIEECKAVAVLWCKEDTYWFSSG